ncbi:MAG: (Fe-S)-binding protein [Polyangiaceae bacterium]
MSDRLSLPLLRPHDETLQKCVYCPKLSRAACPVANVEANETVTPWGKMSMAYFAARGDVPIDAEHAESAWACSGCFACRERCEHKNEVADVLYDARAEYYQAGVAPAAARRAALSFQAHQHAVREAVDAIDTEARKAARVVVLLGCSYAKNHPEVARAIWRVASHAVDGEVRAARACCGLPLLHAGDRPGLVAAAGKLLAEVQDAELVVAADPGCAQALMHALPSRTAVPKTVVPLVDLVYARLDRFPGAVFDEEPPRYHDPCQLGRGLGRYDEPRAILARLYARAPAEFARRRGDADCSGAGALLPLTRPETSAAMADARIAEHQREGGGTLVTACAESLRRFRSRGEDAQDLWQVVARALDAV